MKHNAPSYHILINEYSGTVLRLGKETLEAMIARSPISVKTLDILPPKAFFQKLKTIQDSDHPILIGGGDGTIKTAADMMMNQTHSFGILPMGTMNLLANDLGIPIDIEESLDAYARTTSMIKIDIGMMNDESFLCCAGIGTMPETSEFREDNREQNDAILMPRLTIFILNQMDRMKHRLMRVSLDGKQRTIKTAALVISNNRYLPQDDGVKNNFQRPSLSDGQLGIYSAAPVSLWQRLRLMINLRLGDWRNDPMINEWSAQTMSLKTKSKEELVSLDGETRTVQTPLNFWIEREALSVLIPASEQKEAA